MTNLPFAETNQRLAPCVRITREDVEREAVWKIMQYHRAGNAHMTGRLLVQACRELGDAVIADHLLEHDLVMVHPSDGPPAIVEKRRRRRRL